MRFEECIELEQYKRSAVNQIDGLKKKIKKLEQDLSGRKLYKRTSALVVDMFFVVLFGAAYYLFSLMVWDAFQYKWMLVAAGAVFGLLLVLMLFDIGMDFEYNSSLKSYKRLLKDLQEEATSQMDQMTVRQIRIDDAADYGWNMDLGFKDSLMEETLSLASDITDISSLKKGFITKAKSTLYFFSVGAVSTVTCIGLYPLATRLYELITKSVAGQNLMLAVGLASLVLVLLAESSWSRRAWRTSKCDVGSGTLFILLSAPGFFLTLVAVAALIIRFFGLSIEIPDFWAMPGF